MHFMYFDLIFITIHKDMFYLFHFIKKRNETENFGSLSMVTPFVVKRGSEPRISGPPKLCLLTAEHLNAFGF